MKKVFIRILYDDPVDELVDYWGTLFWRRYKLEYNAKPNESYNLVLSLFMYMQSDVPATKNVMREFLTNPNFNWVNNKTLNWLCTTSNLKYIIPNLNLKPKNARPNWTDTRGIQQSVTAI